MHKINRTIAILTNCNSKSIIQKLSFTSITILTNNKATNPCRNICTNRLSFIGSTSKFFFQIFFRNTGKVNSCIGSFFIFFNSIKSVPINIIKNFQIIFNNMIDIVVPVLDKFTIDIESIEKILKRTEFNISG